MIPRCPIRSTTQASVRVVCWSWPLEWISLSIVCPNYLDDSLDEHLTVSPDRIVIVTFLHATAIALTVLRLRYRKRTHRLWWDDFTVFLAVVLDCGYVITLWFPYTSPGAWNIGRRQMKSTKAIAGSILHSGTALIARYWLTLMLFFVVIW